MDETVHQLQTPPQYSNAIHIAAFKGELAAVKEMLLQGISIETKTEDDEGPLHIACEYGYKEVVPLLLEHKANVNAALKNGATPLYVACEYGQKEVVLLLLNKKANVNGTKERNPLEISQQNGFDEIVALLKFYGGN